MRFSSAFTSTSKTARRSGGRAALAQRASVLRQILKGNDLADLERALRKINAYLAAEILPEAKGLAIFVRGNLGGAFLLPMQFAVPVPNWIAVYPMPNIYHLDASDMTTPAPRLGRR